MIDVDEIRKEVALRHNVLLGKNDPILVTITLNELVLDRYIALADGQRLEQQKAISAAIHTQVEQAKDTAGKLITESAAFVSDQVREAVALAIQDAGLSLRDQLAAAHSAGQNIKSDVEAIRSARMIAIASAAIAIVCAVAAIGAVLMAKTITQ
jgi:hypothetical protein